MPVATSTQQAEAEVMQGTQEIADGINTMNDKRQNWIWWVLIGGLGVLLLTTITVVIIKLKKTNKSKT